MSERRSAPLHPPRCGESAQAERTAAGTLRRCRLAVVVLIGLVVACDGGTRVVTFGGAGVIFGSVYLDVDGSRTAASPDVPLQGVGVRLVVAGTLDTVARAATDGNGTFAFGPLPVGRYTIVVPPAGIFGDSLVVARVDTSDVSLALFDTTEVQIAVSFPLYPVAEARARQPEEKIFIEGLALNGAATFGDSSVHLADTSGAMRAIGTRGYPAATGDSVRILGRTSARNGQPVIENGQAILIAASAPPVAARITTLEAASAAAGALDAALVKVVDATIGADTATVNGEYQVTVDDGTGPVTVVFDQDVGFSQLRTQYVPGAVIDATGLLVPDGSGSWRLKPRTNVGNNPDVVVK
jgi:hypothetical protein